MLNTMGYERTVWRGTPSQMTNFGTFIFCALFCWLIFPIFIALWRFLLVRCTVYELTNQRLKISRGVFNQSKDEIELYRVKDTHMEQPFLLRLFRLGNLTIYSSDRNLSEITLSAIHNPQKVRENLRRCVENCRDFKGVHGLDFNVE